MKVRNIAGLYLRGWFWFDIVVVSVDWVLNILEVVNNTKNVGGIGCKNGKRKEKSNENT